MSLAGPARRGVVLAGGESRRMGIDKARLPVAGVPLWRRQVNVLRAAGTASVAVVLRRGQPPLAPDFPHLRDTVAASGPLAGLHAALAGRRARWVAVLAVDLPQLDAAWFRWLGGFCRPGVGAIARQARGFEPLAAIYPREALPEATRRLRDQVFSLQCLVAALVRQRRMIAVPLPAVERWRTENWNTPQEVRNFPAGPGGMMSGIH